MMSTGELTALLESYNRTQLRWGIGSLVLAMLLWVLSYGFVLLFVFLMSFVFFRSMSVTAIHQIITAAVMGVLLLDAIRCQRELFDFERFFDSFYSLGAGQYHVSFTGDRISITRGNFLQAAWGFSECLLCAPRCTMAAVRRLRSRVPVDQGMVMSAVKHFTHLSRTSEWIDVTMFGQEAAALKYLDVTDLVWTRIESDRPQVKLAADARTRYVRGMTPHSKHQ